MKPIPFNRFYSSAAPKLGFWLSKLLVVLLALGLGLTIATVHHAFHNVSTTDDSKLLDAAITRCIPWSFTTKNP